MGTCSRRRRWNHPPPTFFSPQFEVLSKDVLPSPSDPPPFTLMGGPVANNIITYIDYTTTISRNLHERFECPDMLFSNDGIGIPTTIYWVNLDPVGTVNNGQGTRPYVSSMRFVNGADTVEAGTFVDTSKPPVRVLFDTGNSATQITLGMASLLGIATNAQPDRQFCRGGMSPASTCTGGTLLDGYFVDRMAIDASDGSHKYVLHNPVLFVDSSPTAIEGAAEVNLGVNFFKTTQIIVDGPNSRLGLFIGVPSNLDSIHSLVSGAVSVQAVATRISQCHPARSCGATAGVWL
jgi:hypothetical protein